jgi:hypothetical protein
MSKARYGDVNCVTLQKRRTDFSLRTAACAYEMKQVVIA